MSNEFQLGDTNDLITSPGAQFMQKEKSLCEQDTRICHSILQGDKTYTEAFGSLYMKYSIVDGLTNI